VPELVPDCASYIYILEIYFFNIPYTLVTNYYIIRSLLDFYGTFEINKTFMAEYLQGNHTCRIYKINFFVSLLSKKSAFNIQQVPDYQLKMYVGGEGGTSKSQILNALIDFVTYINQSHVLKRCAYTGTAANTIRGSTIHKLLGFSHCNHADA
jgi:hypothetical protein